jgi:hypothetical protein
MNKPNVYSRDPARQSGAGKVPAKQQKAAPKRKARKRKTPNPGYVGQTNSIASAAPVKIGYGYGNNVPRFDRIPALGALPGMRVFAHAVSSPFSVVAVAGVQTPAFQVGYSLVGPARNWTNSSFGTFPTSALIGAAASTIAGVFQYAYLRRIRVRYLPDAEAGSGTKGSVCLAWQADPNQSIPTSLPEMSNNAVSKTTPVWMPTEIVIDAGQAPRNLREAYQIGTSSTSASSDYHMGAIYVGADGVGVSGRTAAGDVSFLCGRIELDAEVMVWGITA